MECQQLGISHPGSAVAVGIQEGWLIFITYFLPMYISTFFSLCTGAAEKNPIKLLVTEINPGNTPGAHQFGLLRSKILAF